MKATVTAIFTYDIDDDPLRRRMMYGTDNLQACVAIDSGNSLEDLAMIANDDLVVTISIDDRNELTE